MPHFHGQAIVTAFASAASYYSIIFLGILYIDWTIEPEDHRMLRISAVKIILAIAVVAFSSSCSSDFEIRHSGDLHGNSRQSFRYRYVVISPDANYGLEVKAALIRRGYAVLIERSDDLSDRYEMQPDIAAEIVCDDFEEENFDDGRRSVLIRCKMFDLANGNVIYSGAGQYIGTPKERNFITAAFSALWELPGSYGGELASDLPFAERWGRPREPSVARRPQPAPNGPATTPDSAFTSSGTAFFVSQQGHLLTNQHVINGCRRARIFHENAYHAVAVQTADADLDLAVLKWNGVATNMAEFRTGRFIRSGESVVAVGYPLRGLLADEATVTTGIVNSMAGIGNDRRFMQISAPVQPGNSGGPLLDEAGRLVGVVVSKLDAATIFAVTGDIPQNINFAINGQLASDFLNASGVPYAFSSIEDALGVANIADAAKRFTVPVECSPAG